LNDDAVAAQLKAAMQPTVRKTSLHESQQAADLAYWLAQPVQARIDALEALRIHHSQGQAHADTRLQRVCHILPLKQFKELKQG
jgi:hypothetical protein